VTAFTFSSMVWPCWKSHYKCIYILKHLVNWLRFKQKHSLTESDADDLTMVDSLLNSFSQERRGLSYWARFSTRTASK